LISSIFDIPFTLVWFHPLFFLGVWEVAHEQQVKQRCTVQFVKCKFPTNAVVFFELKLIWEEKMAVLSGLGGWIMILLFCGEFNLGIF
jgi:hypothetical protein